MNVIEKHLSTGEYYAQIQREYLIAEFRRRIYFSPKDKRYYERVMGHKRDKINDISHRNRLDSIFNDDALNERTRRELFDYNGKPLFHMTDEDLRNYYSRGAEFAFAGQVWILEQMDGHGDLLLKHNTRVGETTLVHRDLTHRIL